MQRDRRPRAGPVDVGGRVVLGVWVSALQFLLDPGRGGGWFAATGVRRVAVVLLELDVPLPTQGSGQDRGPSRF